MNILILFAGIFAGFTTIGHFTAGSRLYLQPMLRADFDPVARRVMYCVFHYVSVYLVLSSLVLLSVGTGLKTIVIPELLLHFIAANYLGFFVVQLLIALTSNIEKSMVKMFQWLFFILIAAFTWLGMAT